MPLRHNECMNIMCQYGVFYIILLFFLSLKRASALSNRLHSICRCLCVSDAEASDCQLIFHKQVGDTVEFPSCSPPEGVDYPTWNYNKDTVVAENTMTVYPKSMFQDRVELNPKNFSLTVRNLTRQDSGVFSFLSEVNGQQRHTVTITLQVHGEILFFFFFRGPLFTGSRTMSMNVGKKCLLN